MIIDGDKVLRNVLLLMKRVTLYFRKKYFFKLRVFVINKWIHN